MARERSQAMIEFKELTRSDKPVVTGYRAHGFTIGERMLDGGLLLTPEGFVEIAVDSVDDIAAEQLAPVFEADPDIEILLLGGGAQLRFPPEGLRRSLEAAGIAVEPMDSAAAARTFNLLVMEERRVAALLLPVGRA